MPAPDKPHGPSVDRFTMKQMAKVVSRDLESFFQLQIPQRHPEDTVEQVAPYVTTDKIMNDLFAQGSLPHSGASSNQDPSWLFRIVALFARAEKFRQRDLDLLIRFLDLEPGKERELGRMLRRISFLGAACIAARLLNNGKIDVALIHRQSIARESFDLEESIISQIVLAYLDIRVERLGFYTTLPGFVQ